MQDMPSQHLTAQRRNGRTCVARAPKEVGGRGSTVLPGGVGRTRNVLKERPPEPGPELRLSLLAYPPPGPPRQRPVRPSVGPQESGAPGASPPLWAPSRKRPLTPAPLPWALKSREALRIEVLEPHVLLSPCAPYFPHSPVPLKVLSCVPVVRRGCVHTELRSEAPQEDPRPEPPHPSGAVPVRRQAPLQGLGTLSRVSVHQGQRRTPKEALCREMQWPLWF